VQLLKSRLRNTVSLCCEEQKGAIQDTYVLAMIAVFPGVPIRLCQFHVIQAIIRWATSRLRPRRTSSVKALKRQSKGKRVVNTRRHSGKNSNRQTPRKATVSKMRKRRAPTPGDTNAHSDDSESVGDDVPQHGSRLSNGEAINELLDLVRTVQRCREPNEFDAHVIKFNEGVEALASHHNLSATRCSEIINYFQNNWWTNPWKGK